MVDLALGPDRLEAAGVTGLQHLTPERAATYLCDLFRRTGSAQAYVSDPDEVRRLARQDCRRRGIRVRTLAVGEFVLIYNDERYDAFLATPDGVRYSEEMLRRASQACAEWMPTAPRSLRLLPPAK